MNQESDIQASAFKEFLVWNVNCEIHRQDPTRFVVREICNGKDFFPFLLRINGVKKVFPITSMDDLWALLTHYVLFSSTRTTFNAWKSIDNHNNTFSFLWKRKDDDLDKLLFRKVLFFLFLFYHFSFLSCFRKLLSEWWKQSGSFLWNYCWLTVSHSQS